VKSFTRFPWLIGAIPLTPDESGTLAAMKLHQEELVHDSDAAQRNGELAVTLMTSLRLRGAIPEVRLTYFEDPAYRTGRTKGSIVERPGRHCPAALRKHDDFKDLCPPAQN
jgi:hypothetical protein